MSRRTALVTGGSRGIGAATAVRLARDGWNVALTYRRRGAEADRVVDLCRASGVDAWAYAVDVAEPDQIDALFDELDAVDGLVNNAGVVSALGPVASYDAARLRAVVDVNVVGCFLVAAHVVRRMLNRNVGGVIVNVSSRAAVRGGAGEYVDYAASKAAVDALTVGLAAEVAGRGIRVVGVRPGVISTEIHAPGRLERVAPRLPMGRPGEPEEVAAAIAWLMSEEASYVTGTTLDVGGGR